jgi:hypothetical protein
MTILAPSKGVHAHWQAGATGSHFALVDAGRQLRRRTRFGDVAGLLSIPDALLLAFLSGCRR